MQSQTGVENQKSSFPLSQALNSRWENLSDWQRNALKKVWGLISYKWQWQIVLNAPFMLIWILDKSVPAVHEFDMKLLQSLPIPEWLHAMIGNF